jgi:hypothetical protein
VTREGFVRVMASEKFTLAEKRLFEIQFPCFLARPSNFVEKLFMLLLACDEPNLAKMERAFPDEVEAVRCWRRGNLESRFSAVAKELI